MLIRKNVMGDAVLKSYSKKLYSMLNALKQKNKTKNTKVAVHMLSNTFPHAVNSNVKCICIAPYHTQAVQKTK